MKQYLNQNFNNHVAMSAYSDSRTGIYPSGLIPKYTQQNLNEYHGYEYDTNLAGRIPTQPSQNPGGRGHTDADKLRWGNAAQTSNVRIYNPSILHNGRVYYNYYNGVNELITKTPSGRPINVYAKDSNPQPTVRWEKKPLTKDSWYEIDYCKIDGKASERALNEFKRQNNQPMINEIQTSGRDIGKVQPRDITAENINQIKQSKIQPKPIQQVESFGQSAKSATSSETFKKEHLSVLDKTYKQLLRSSSYAVLNFLLNHEAYKPWMKHWIILRDNMEKTNLNIDKLSSNDDEIAYTIDKGEIIKFRWKDNGGYINRNVFLYVLLHELTHESFPVEFQGHGEPFPQMLCLMCMAAVELGILDISKIPTETVISNDRPITSRSIIKQEVLYGVEMLKKANENNPEIVEYYNGWREYIKKI